MPHTNKRTHGRKPGPPGAEGERRSIILRTDGPGKTIDLEARRIALIATALEVDRYRSIILPSALKARLDKFARHSPLLAAHEYVAGDGGPAQIGTIDEVAFANDDVRMAAIYAKHNLAEQYWALASDPTQSVAFSIGFIVLEEDYNTVAILTQRYPEIAKAVQDAGLTPNDSLTVYPAIELLEVSMVAVPANSKAVQLSFGQRTGDGGAALPAQIDAAIQRYVDDAIGAFRQEFQEAMHAHGNSVAAELLLLADHALDLKGYPKFPDAEELDVDGLADGTAENVRRRAGRRHRQRGRPAAEGGRQGR